MQSSIVSDIRAYLAQDTAQAFMNKEHIKTSATDVDMFIYPYEEDFFPIGYFCGIAVEFKPRNERNKPKIPISNLIYFKANRTKNAEIMSTFNGYRLCMTKVSKGALVFLFMIPNGKCKDVTKGFNDNEKKRYDEMEKFITQAKDVIGWEGE